MMIPAKSERKQQWRQAEEESDTKSGQGEDWKHFAETAGLPWKRITKEERLRQVHRSEATPQVELLVLSTCSMQKTLRSLKRQR